MFSTINCFIKVNGINYNENDNTKSGGVQITSKDKVNVILICINIVFV